MHECANKSCQGRRVRRASQVECPSIDEIAAWCGRAKQEGPSQISTPQARCRPRTRSRAVAAWRWLRLRAPRRCGELTVQSAGRAYLQHEAHWTRYLPACECNSEGCMKGHHAINDLRHTAANEPGGQCDKCELEYLAKHERNRCREQREPHSPPGDSWRSVSLARALSRAACTSNPLGSVVFVRPTDASNWAA